MRGLSIEPGPDRAIVQPLHFDSNNSNYKWRMG